MTGWLDVAAPAATVVAAALAAYSIRQSSVEARRSAEALLKERQLDFELERLMALADAIEKAPNIGFSIPDGQMALRLLPGRLLPMSRAMFDQSASDDDRALLAKFQREHAVTSERPWEPARPALRLECERMIFSVLAERSAARGVSERLAKRVWRPAWASRQ